MEAASDTRLEFTLTIESPLSEKLLSLKNRTQHAAIDAQCCAVGC
jgi:hypothetical protein